MAGSVSIFAEKQFFISPGVPAANCKLSTYLAGTLTFSTTWQDRDQTITNTNPITLDANGLCTIWLANGVSYDMVLRDPTNTTVIETFDDVTGALSSVTSSSSEWVTSGLTTTFVNATTFTVSGNHTTTGSKIYERGRRIRTLEGIVNKYGTVISSTFAAGITTVVCNMQGGTSITSGLTTVDYGILSVSSPSSLTGLGSVLNLTGYTGSDVPLEVGQTTYYEYTAITSLPLRIATATNQEYVISMVNDSPAAATPAAVATLQINNTTLGATAVSGQLVESSGTALAAAFYQTNAYIICGLFRINSLTAIVKTRTNGKSCHSEWIGGNLTSFAEGRRMQTCNGDTTTVHSSLGTITSNLAMTGIVKVTRTL
jgi:hypothetical protein